MWKKIKINKNFHNELRDRLHDFGVYCGWRHKFQIAYNDSEYRLYVHYISLTEYIFEVPGNYIYVYAHKNRDKQYCVKYNTYTGKCISVKFFKNSPIGYKINDDNLYYDKIYNGYYNKLKQTVIDYVQQNKEKK